MSEDFVLRAIQANNERQKLRHRERIEPTSQIFRKQELERNQLLQRFSPLYTVVQHDTTALEKNTDGTFNMKKVVSHQVARSEFLITSLFIFDILGNLKRAFISDKCCHFN